MVFFGCKWDSILLLGPLPCITSTANAEKQQKLFNQSYKVQITALVSYAVAIRQNFRSLFANDHSQENFWGCYTAHIASCVKPIE